MTVTPDLSVIIVTFNVRELAIACLQSVEADAARSVSTVELSVVDNASTDGSAEAIRQGFPRARLVASESNLGFSAANNVGLRLAAGRYMLCLNPDTVVQPGALDALVSFMDAHPDAGACGPQLLNEDGTIQPSGRDLPSVWTVFLGLSKLYRLWTPDFYRQPGRDYAQVARVGELSGSALLVRREAYERLGGFDERLWAYYEDVDWCKRIGEAGYAIYFVPAARVTHLWKRSSRTVPELTYRVGQNSTRYYFRKHHGRLAAGVVQAMLAAKELVLIGGALLRRDAAGAAFHRRMLANIFAPLP